MSTKKPLIDHSLRATWQAVSKMYSEVARKYGITMALGLTLLNIDPKNGTASTALGPIMGTHLLIASLSSGASSHRLWRRR